ncbi:hypothetical protein TNCV_3592171 [Trichonephila clavipes]|nr:hypothetical protein TNCV_3592171 [Trichonephila clavipes]
MYGSTCADMQVDVMGECLSSIKHVVGNCDAGYDIPAEAASKNIYLEFAYKLKPSKDMTLKSADRRETIFSKNGLEGTLKKVRPWRKIGTFVLFRERDRPEKGIQQNLACFFHSQSNADALRYIAGASNDDLSSTQGSYTIAS